jgi:2-phosphoglycerate kinase
MEDIKIKKRSGEVEYFNFDKLLASIGRAGVPLKEATKIAEKVRIILIAKKSKSPVSSESLRDNVLQLMTKDFPAEADSYNAYK